MGKKESDSGLRVLLGSLKGTQDLSAAERLRGVQFCFVGIGRKMSFRICTTKLNPRI